MCFQQYAQARTNWDAQGTCAGKACSGAHQSTLASEASVAFLGWTTAETELLRHQHVAGDLRTAPETRAYSEERQPGPSGGKEVSGACQHFLLLIELSLASLWSQGRKELHPDFWERVLWQTLSSEYPFLCRQRFWVYKPTNLGSLSTYK